MKSLIKGFMMAMGIIAIATLLSLLVSVFTSM